MIACDESAAWSVFQPAWSPRSARFVFMCDWHKEQFLSTKRIPGLDPPEGMSREDYKPSIVAMIVLADMEIRRQQRAREMQNAAAIHPLDYELARHRNLPPAQRASLQRLQSAMREHRP